MSPELIGILSVGGALFAGLGGLGGLILTTTGRINARIDRFDDRSNSQFDDLRADVQGLDRRVSRLEGLIEGLFAGANGRATRRMESEESSPQAGG